MRSTRQAIPSTYRGCRMRSRLECRWSAFFDLLGWGWDYEPLDLGDTPRPGRIPDFLLRFASPTLIECKPAVTIDEIAAYRKSLIAIAADWLCEDYMKALRELDTADELPGDLRVIDAVLAQLEAVQERHENPLWGRRAIVVGAQLMLDAIPPVAYVAGGGVDAALWRATDCATLDGEHVFAQCLYDTKHFGLRTTWSDACLVCGGRTGAVFSSSDVITVWRRAGSETQWKPSGERLT